MNVYDRILVTGGRGMLANAFARRFAGSALHVTFADRSVCDVCDEDSCTRAFQRLQPTLVFNCAAYTKVDLAEKEQASAEQCNGYGVGHLAELCRDYGTMLVHFSTDYVFDGSVQRPLQPGDPLGPLSAYGKSKLLGERLLQESPPARWLILRTAWLYGPGGPCFPATMVNAAKAGRPLKVIDDQHGTPTFTDDLVEAALNLVHLGAQGVWHLTNSGETTWYDFTAAILDEFGLKADLSRTTSAEWKKLKPEAAPRPAYSVLDVTPYEAFTHLPMPGWRDALHRYRTVIEIDVNAHAGRRPGEWTRYQVNELLREFQRPSTLPPIFPITAMAATQIRPAMRAYSSVSPPLWSRQRRKSKLRAYGIGRAFKRNC